MIIDLFLVALLSLVCLVLTDSSSLVTRLTEECYRSDGERSLEWQTPAVAYPFGSLHDLCVAVVVVLLDEVVRHFRQDLSILLIICHKESTTTVSNLDGMFVIYPGCQTKSIDRLPRIGDDSGRIVFGTAYNSFLLLTLSATVFSHINRLFI